MCYLNLGLCFNLVLDSYKYMDISFALKAWGGERGFLHVSRAFETKILDFSL